ncbi:unnamed protein product, partial [marine sediment metagenome]
YDFPGRMGDDLPAILSLRPGGDLWIRREGSNLSGKLSLLFHQRCQGFPTLRKIQIRAFEFDILPSDTQNDGAQN